MTPFFGHKDDAPVADKPDAAAATAAVDALDAMALTQLAAQVMVKGFGPGGPAADDTAITVGQMSINSGPTVADLAYLFVNGFAADTEDQHQRLLRIIADAVQALEHASLVRAQMHTSTGSLDYAATRYGRAAIEQNAVDRILAGGTLQL